MKRVIEFPLDSSANSSTVYVEVDEPEALMGHVQAGLADTVVERASQTFAEALDRIRPMAATLVSALRELNEPAEIEIEFGIKLSAEAGALIASATSEANFGVKLTWRNTKA